MTDHQTNQQQRSQHREDYKVQKLVERIETKLALQGEGDTRSQSSKLKKLAMPET
jgi:hypothetical protein